MNEGKTLELARALPLRLSVRGCFSHDYVVVYSRGGGGAGEVKEERGGAGEIPPRLFPQKQPRLCYNITNVHA